MKTDTTNPIELLEKAAETCYQSMKEGLKMQKQFAERWFSAVKEASGKEDWAERMQQAADKVTKQAKENAEQAMHLIEQGARDGMALLNKAVDLGGISTPGEAQVKIQQLWQESLNVVNSNAKAMVEANTKMMQAWAEMAKENVEKASAAASKAVKA